MTTWPLVGPSLDELLDGGAVPADAPAPDWSLLDEVVEAVNALTEKLRAEPELSRSEALLFVKENAPGQSIHFRSLLWPQARRLVGLPPGRRGRPVGARTRRNPLQKTTVPFPNEPARLVGVR
jgi:hypothetical protein